jgi:hypothetical protein
LLSRCCFRPFFGRPVVVEAEVVAATQEEAEAVEEELAAAR